MSEGLDAFTSMHQNPQPPPLHLGASPPTQCISFVHSWMRDCLVCQVHTHSVHRLSPSGPNAHLRIGGATARDASWCLCNSCRNNNAPSHICRIFKLKLSHVYFIVGTCPAGVTPWKVQALLSQSDIAMSEAITHSTVYHSQLQASVHARVFFFCWY